MVADGVIVAMFAGEAVFWVGAYLLIIRRAFVDKSYGMPVVAMCGNISWEFLYGVGLFPACPSLWEGCPGMFLQVATLGAALLDTVIVFTILRFGPQQFRQPQVRNNLPWLVLLGIVVAVSVIYTSIAGFYTLDVGGQAGFLPIAEQGGDYTGFGLALMMSILFIAMFVSRDSLSGQSFYIALFMAVGNGFAYLYNYFIFNGRLAAIVNVLAAASLLFNVAYAYFLYRKSQALGVNPWRRF